MPKRARPDGKDGEIASAAKKAKQSKTDKRDGSGAPDGNPDKPKKAKGGQQKAVNYSSVEEAQEDLAKIHRALEQAVRPNARF